MGYNVFVKAAWSEVIGLLGSEVGLSEFQAMGVVGWN